MDDVIIIGGEAGKAAADDDDVIHGEGLRVVDGGSGLGLARNIVQRYAQRLADGRLDVVVMRDHAQRPVMLESAFEREL